MPRTLAEAARGLNARTARRPRKAALPHVILLTDPRLPDVAAAVARLPRGAAVILRHYDDPEREALGRKLVQVCRERGLLLLIADDWRLAARLGAAGLHLTERTLRSGRLAPALDWRRWSGALLSVAAHGATALRLAERVEADLALLSPVFPTRSHPGARVLGPTRFAALVRGTTLPVIALGGVTARMVGALAGSKAWGVAAIDGWDASVSSPATARPSPPA